MVHYRSDWRRERKIAMKHKTGPKALTAATHKLSVLGESWRKHKQTIMSETVDNRARSPQNLSNWGGMLLGRFELNTGRRTWACLERHGRLKNPIGLAAEATEYAAGVLAENIRHYDPAEGL